MSIVVLAREVLSGDADVSEDQLVSILTEASDQYHNDGESFLSDAEYDAIEQMLKAAYPKSLFLTQVGSDVRGGKIKLPVGMGSLDQVYEGETLKWIRANGWEREVFVLSDKMDGTSGLLCYGKQKSLSIAYSRGNGIEGADITRHVGKIKTTPSKAPESCMVRTEVIMEGMVFDAQKAAAEAEGGRVYKNARNYVAGRMNASNSPQIFYDTVRVVGTSVVEPKMGKAEQFKFMEDMGFEVPHYITAYGEELTDEFLVAHLTDRRSKTTMAIDGIVIDLDDRDIRASLRRNSSSLNPMYSRKFKVGGDDNVAVTEVVKVHYEPSKTGYLKPRVEIVPVDLVGVTITYATGFNAKFIRDNGVGPGAKIQITRAGDVIPFIQKVIDPVTPQLPTEAEYGDMAWTPGDVDMYLLDADNNSSVQINKLIDVFAGLDVPFLRQGSLEKLHAAGYTKATDIINADKADLTKVLGDSSGTKAYEGIQAKLNPVPLGILAGSSQCMGRGIGRRKMTRLIEAMGGNDAFMDAALKSDFVDKVSVVEGFERKTAETIAGNYPNFIEFLEAIDGKFTLAAPKAKVVGGALDGIVVVFTGIRDKELEEAITNKGGTIGGSVNAKTTHLVCKDPSSNSGKMGKAKDLGVAVIGIIEAQGLWA
jgi:DNA ligase (NAD+)